MRNGQLGEHRRRGLERYIERQSQGRVVLHGQYPHRSDDHHLANRYLELE